MLGYFLTVVIDQPDIKTCQASITLILVILQKQSAYNSVYVLIYKNCWYWSSQWWYWSCIGGVL